MKKAIKYSIASLTLLTAILIIWPMGIFPLVLLQSLAVQILFVYIFITVLAIYYKSWINILSGITALLMLMTFLWPYIYLNKPPNSGKKGEIGVAHFNVLLFNRDFKATIVAAKNSEADILSFQEVDQIWCDSLNKGLKDQYPFQLQLPDNASCFGLTLFSKHPISNSVFTQIGGKPIVEANILYKGRIIHLITTHTNSPVSQFRFNNRNDLLKELKNKIDLVSGTTLLIGDFNVVPWDDNFKQLVASQKVIDSRTNYGGTYPSWSFIGKIPIDYILHTTDLQCTQFKTIDGTSSDHLGIYSEFKLRPIQNVAKN